MSHLVGNGTHLYRRSSHLVRTPIHLALSPDERAVYSVAGQYGAATGHSDHWPIAGFIREQATTAKCYQVGSDCIQAYLNPQSQYQIWHSVSTAHDPELVWYQGSYSTSGANAQHCFDDCEAFMQLCAYHFTIPTGLQGLTASAVTVKFTLGGGVRCFQSPATGSASNSTLSGVFDFTNWYIPIAVASSLAAPTAIAQLPYDAKVNFIPSTGTFRGARDIWDFGSSTRDGGIATLSSPPTVSYTLGTSTLAQFNALKGGWIIPYFDADWTNATNYHPYYVDTTRGYWACVSAWGFSLELDMD